MCVCEYLYFYAVCVRLILWKKTNSELAEGVWWHHVPSAGISLQAHTNTSTYSFTHSQLIFWAERGLEVLMYYKHFCFAHRHAHTHTNTHISWDSWLAMKAALLASSVSIRNYFTGCIHVSFLCVCVSVCLWLFAAWLFWQCIQSVHFFSLCVIILCVTIINSFKHILDVCPTFTWCYVSVCVCVQTTPVIFCFLYPG